MFTVLEAKQQQQQIIIINYQLFEHFHNYTERLGKDSSSSPTGMPETVFF